LSIAFRSSDSKPVSIGFSLHIEYRLDLFDDLVERIAVIEPAVVKVEHEDTFEKNNR